MKNFKLTLATFVAITLISPSCTNNDNAGDGCLLEVVPTKMNFKIQDKGTQRDLFFGTNPTYSLDDLSFSMKDISSRKSKIIKFDVSETSGEKYFTVSLPVPTKSQDTLFINISDTPTDTLTYTTQLDHKDFCPQYILDKVSFNNSLVASNTGLIRLVLQKSRYTQ